MTSFVFPFFNWWRKEYLVYVSFITSFGKSIDFKLICQTSDIQYIYMNTIWLAFLTGLTTGGLSCLAVQGGLLASSISVSEGVNRFRHVSIFLIAKLIAYASVGYLLGTVGSSLTLSPKILGSVQIMVGLFMLATAARLLDVHPIFRYVVIQPPRWVYRLLKRQSISASMFAPAMLGFFTVLMPCGITQATMAIAMASGNPLMGAAIMFAFVLGTSPIFFALGASVVELLNHKAFTYVAAGVVAIFAALSINGGLGLRGSLFTVQNFYRAATTDVGVERSGAAAPVSTDGFQEVSIQVSDNGYTASSDTLKVGVPVRVTLATSRTRGCARAFTVPEYGVSKILPETGEEVIEFTPKKIGRLAYTCSMGMYTGAFNIIN